MSEMKFDAQTKVEDVLKAYPWLKEELPKINKDFNLLNTEAAKTIVPVANLGMVAAKFNISTDELIKKLEDLIAGRK